MKAAAFPPLQDPPRRGLGRDGQPPLLGALRDPPLVWRPRPHVIFPENVGFALYPPT